ncbi:MAG TPA: phage tail protein, partial [candidate division Zixibacteria bacterium]|nr:phage tail protein [candidate division Zixibacteria bacterium]
MNRFKWWLAGILTVVAVTASAKMVVNGYLEKAGFETAAADPVLNLFTGRMYYNTTSNTVKFYNGATWGDVGSGLSVPTGTIAPQVGTTVPAGWLAADGSCQTIATYPALAAEVVTGGWNQATCAGGEFRMPDLRNRFLRGTGTQGVDVNGGTAVALGVDQDDATAENGMDVDGSPSINRSTMNTTTHDHNQGTLYARIGISSAGSTGTIGLSDSGTSFSSNIDFNIFTVAGIASATLNGADVVGNTGTDGGTQTLSVS